MKKLLFAISIVAMLSPALYGQDSTKNSRMNNRSTTDQSRSSSDRGDSTADSNKKKNKKDKKQKKGDHMHSDSTSYRR